jgi:MarR family transcriptional regulator, organic hydroperoxide resistance regulator
MNNDQLKLDNQLCFPVYAASRLIIREYQPLLGKLGLTYPQYLVMLVLWETNKVSVNDISGRLILNTNTVTPLLKRMESMGVIVRKRSGKDERKVVISLTEKGRVMKKKAAAIPGKLAARLGSGELTAANLGDIRRYLTTMVALLCEKGK